MIWRLSHRFSRSALVLADRHYNRQKPGTPQFVAPGSPVVLVYGEPVSAVWVTLRQKYVDHAWKLAWTNTLFRNESVLLSSLLIREAMAATRAMLGEPPPEGVISFVDAARIRHKRDPGRCYRRAGFDHVASLTRDRKLVFQLPPAAWPIADYPIGATPSMFRTSAV